MTLAIPSPIQSLDLTCFKQKNIQVEIKRDDVIDPIISGNKFRKLQGHLADYQRGDFSGFISMGGPWSNHLHALAKVCYDSKLPLVCLIRGPEPKTYSQALVDITNWGARLVFLTRAEYRELREAYISNKISETETLKSYDKHYFLPEGGYGQQAMVGIEALANELPSDYDYIYLGVGTGTTMAGLINAYRGTATKIMGILALKAGNSQSETIKRLCPEPKHSWQLYDDFVGSGFAQSSHELETFMAHIYNEVALITEPVYTAKALYGLCQHIDKSVIQRDSKVLFLHTGGLQGLRGYSSETCRKLAIAAGF